MMLDLILRRLQACLEKTPGYSTCKRCWRPWNRVEGHMTECGRGTGCFPLCEHCWGVLSPKERVPFYRKMWLSWLRESQADGEPPNIPWGVVESACLHERPYLPIDSLKAGMALCEQHPDKYEAVTGGDGEDWLKPTVPPEVLMAWEIHDRSPRR